MTGASVADAAHLRNLRDIADGHLIIWVKLLRVDQQAPEILDITPDRTPAAGTPNRQRDWWTPLVHKGWIRLPNPYEPQCYRPTDAGLAAVAANTSKETSRG